MQENTDQKNSEYGHFSCSVKLILSVTVLLWWHWLYDSDCGDDCGSSLGMEVFDLCFTKYVSLLIISTFLLSSNYDKDTSWLNI